jgi:hypothetical protein
MVGQRSVRYENHARESAVRQFVFVRRSLSLYNRGFSSNLNLRYLASIIALLMEAP